MWLHQTTEVNTTNNTVVKYNLKYSHQSLTVTPLTLLIQLRHAPQLLLKLEFNLQTAVWGWVVGPDYGV